MPAPTITIDVHDTPQGRRIYKDETEAAINAALGSLFSTIAAIPAGPEGPRGPAGLQGERWITGTTREYSEGLTCVVGNAVYRRYNAQGVVGLFRCIQNTTINSNNFPASAVSNSAWELILVIPQGERGPQGIQGIQGPRGNDGVAGQNGADGADGQDGQDGAPGADGVSVEFREFATDAEAQTYAAAHPLAIVVSTEGLE